MRTKPYTEIGIRRVPCTRCGEKSTAQWNICAIGKSYQGLCNSCDIDLNALVLDFIKHPKKEVLMKHYKGAAT
jgi:hypothetical protein